MTNTDFLPENYEVPQNTSRYTKLETGENRIRILRRPIVGWQDWKEKKPFRFKVKPDKPLEPNGKIKHFWAFPIWNYKTKQIEICEITQVGIQKSIEAFARNEEWGSPLNYDITIIRVGEGLETEYTVMPQPPKPLNEEIEKTMNDTYCDLDKLYDGKDPFTED